VSRIVLDHALALPCQTRQVVVLLPFFLIAGDFTRNCMKSTSELAVLKAEVAVRLSTGSLSAVTVPFANAQHSSPELLIGGDVRRAVFQPRRQ
jgi:hypothetical protein